MNTPRENAQRVTDLRAQVEAHPMCARFSDAEGRYRVIYPLGAHPYLDGAQASQAFGKASALTRLLEAMEKHWQEGYPR